MSNFETEITDRHAKKLSALVIKTYVIINANFINKEHNGISRVEKSIDADTVVNKSKRALSETELTVLKKGLKYGIKSKRIDKFEILSRLEMLAQSLKQLPHKPTELSDASVETDDRRNICKVE